MVVYVNTGLLYNSNNDSELSTFFRYHISFFSNHFSQTIYLIDTRQVNENEVHPYSQAVLKNSVHTMVPPSRSVENRKPYQMIDYTQELPEETALWSFEKVGYHA